MTVTNDTYLQPAVAAEFLNLADLLAAASDAKWDTPSLCESWRVREGVAHMTMAARYSQTEVMAEPGGGGFDFGRVANGGARPDAKVPEKETHATLPSPP